MVDPPHPPIETFTPVPLEEPGSFSVTYEMVLTEAELARLAVHLDGGDALVRGDRAVSVRLDDGRGWSITLGPERRRRIALFDLPLCDATIRLDGYDAAGTEAFLARFHRVFRKGGG